MKRHDFDWRKKPPDQWTRDDARHFAAHLMEPITGMMVERVLMILAAAAGKDINEVFPQTRVTPNAAVKRPAVFSAGPLEPLVRPVSGERES